MFTLKQAETENLTLEMQFLTLDQPKKICPP